MNSFLQIPKSILKSYVYNGSSIFISGITLKKKTKQKLLTILPVSAMGTEHEIFFFLKLQIWSGSEC